jgi:hypothetical protein
MNLMNHYRTQKRRVYSVDRRDKAFLTGEPPDPQANTVGHHHWREKNGGDRYHEDQQNDQEDSIFKRHRNETKNWLVRKIDSR